MTTEIARLAFQALLINNQLPPTTRLEDVLAYCRESNNEELMLYNARTAMPRNGYPTDLSKQELLHIRNEPKITNHNRLAIIDQALIFHPDTSLGDLRQMTNYKDDPAWKKRMYELTETLTFPQIMDEIEAASRNGARRLTFDEKDRLTFLLDRMAPHLNQEEIERLCRVTNNDIPSHKQTDIVTAWAVKITAIEALFQLAKDNQHFHIRKAAGRRMQALWKSISAELRRLYEWKAYFHCLKDPDAWEIFGGFLTPWVGAHTVRPLLRKCKREKLPPYMLDVFLAVLRDETFTLADLIEIEKTQLPNGSIYAEKFIAGYSKHLAQMSTQKLLELFNSNKDCINLTLAIRRQLSNAEHVIALREMITLNAQT